MKPSLSKYNIDRDISDLIKRSGVDVRSFKGKRILVTGGTGFFGIWMLSALVEIKAMLGGDLTIKVLSRSPSKFCKTYGHIHFEKDIEFIQGDVATFKIYESQITHLIHMASTNASETFAGEDQINKLDMLYQGTKNTINQCGKSLESVLFTSSGVAYGVNKNGFISEDDFTAPNTTDIGSALGIGKLTAEYLTSYYSKIYGYKYSIARCFAFAGQYLPLNLHYAFGNFISDAINEKKITIRGHGQDIRSYLYVADAVAWLLRMVAEPKNEVFNVGSEISISMESLAQKVSQIAKSNLGVEILGKVDVEGNFARSNYTPSTKKIRSYYEGLSEWTKIDKIIEKMLDQQRIIL